MARLFRLQDSYNTEVPEKRTEQFADDAAEVRTDLVLEEGISPEKIPDFATASSVEEIIEGRPIASMKWPTPYENLITKNVRARASALMDLNCLKFLGLFHEKRHLNVDALGEHIEKNADWLKIALLVKADLLENLDSTLRITADGIEAWVELQRFQKISRTE